MAEKRETRAGRKSCPGLIAHALEKQVNNERRAARRLTKGEKEAQAAQIEAEKAEAQAASVKRVAALEREIATEDAMDDTPQPKPGKRKATRPRQQRQQSPKLGKRKATQPRQQRQQSPIPPESEASEAPTPCPEATTDLDTTQSESETPKAKRTKKEKLAFRRAVDEAELTNTEKPKKKTKMKEQPKLRPLARTESLVLELPVNNNEQQVVPEESLDVSDNEMLITPKPHNKNKQSKNRAKVGNFVGFLFQIDSPIVGRGRGCGRG